MSVSYTFNGNNRHSTTMTTAPQINILTSIQVCWLTTGPQGIREGNFETVNLSNPRAINAVRHTLYVYQNGMNVHPYNSFLNCSEHSDERDRRYNNIKPLSEEEVYHISVIMEIRKRRRRISDSLVGEQFHKKQEEIAALRNLLPFSIPGSWTDTVG